MVPIVHTPGPLDLHDEPAPSYGQTHRDFTVLLWLRSTPDGWECNGLMHAPLADFTGHFAMDQTFPERRQAIAASMARARRSIDRWYAAAGL